MLLVLLTSWRLGFFEQFRDPAAVKQTLVQLGPWGYLVFIAVFAAFQPFGIPGTAFVLSAALIWPWPVAFLLSMAGTMAASVVGFSFARFVARDWVSAKIPDRFRKYDDALAERALSTVFLLRLIFWMPPLLHASFGVSKVRFGTHFWGSFAGYLLPIFLMCFFGQRLFDKASEVLNSVGTPGWCGIGFALAAVVVVGWAIRQWRTRHVQSTGQK